MATKSVHVRIDEKLKKRLEQLCDDIGIDLPTAVRMFFRKFDRTGTLPFQLGQEHEIDNYTPEQLAEFDRIAEEAEKGIGVSGPFNSVEEMWKDIMSKEP